MYAVEAKCLFKSYRAKGRRIEVLKNLSMQVKKGEMVAVMGASGSGKTTLLHNLSGIDVPDSGEIFIDDKDLSSFSREELALFRRKNIGMVFQDFQLLECLSVGENILLPMILDKQSEKKQKRQLRKVLEMVGIEELSERGITELSGGQKQRVAIARALVQEPNLIFADEPTGNLDGQTAENILCCLSQLNQKTGASMLIVTHDLHTASFCHRTLRMEAGGVIDDIL